MELASAIQDEFLTCNICLEGYTRPKQLPCLHTFCLKCLSHYITQTVGQSGVLAVPCPICRRTCVPPDPDPRKLHQWADQFPDNFFLASLRETVKARTRDLPGDQTAADDSNSSSGDSPRKTSFFMGEVTTCATHPTQRLSRFCLHNNAGVCQECLGAAVHRSCLDKDHLDVEQARSTATESLTKYRQRMEQAKQEVADVKQAFGRKPRRLQMRKEEVEITIGEFFSALRSSCAKLLLAKEKETTEKLSSVIEDESGKTGDAQKKCDDVTSSMNNTLSLLDALVRSGPFNAMHVLGKVEGQMANISRLLAKMSQEAQSDSVSFQPPSESVEDHLSNLHMGEIVADFGSGDMSVDAGGEEQGATAAGGIFSASSTTAEEQTHGSGFGAPRLTTAREGTLQNLESQMSELNISDASALAANQADPSLTREPEADPPYPSAPPLDNLAPPPYSPDSSQHLSLPPSAPPISSLPPADIYHRSRASSSSSSLSSSSAMSQAWQQSMRRDFSCKPLMVFSGNLPKESRRGGICGAASLDKANRAAFVDRHNHSVKIIDLHLAQIVGFLHLGDLEPWDITFVTDRRELVVTCPSMQYLLYIPTETQKLAIEYYFKLRCGYCCVAHLKEDQFVGGVCAPFGPPAVHIFNLQGVILREILRGEFSYPRTIFADPAGTQIVVSDWTSNVVVLVTSEGQVVSRYREAPGPKGVTFSPVTGLLYVLDGKWNRLHLLDVTGQCLGTGKVEGCRDPRMVIVVPSSSSHFADEELTVIADGNNALHVMSTSASNSGAMYSTSDVQSTV